MIILKIVFRRIGYEVVDIFTDIRKLTVGGIFFCEQDSEPIGF